MSTIRSVSGSGDLSKDDHELNDELNDGSPALSRQNSTDLLAAVYVHDEVRLTDDEQLQDNVKLKEDAKKLAQRCLEINETLKATYKFAEAVENEINALKRELEQSVQSNTQNEREIGKLKERIRQLGAMGDMLQYGTQGKCGVCGEASKKISESHPYSRVVLETVLKANYSGIFDLQQDKSLEPSSCKWRHLCSECDSATGSEERKFKEYLESVLEGSVAATSEKIFQSHADLFHVYTFRALLHNIDTHHYIQEKDQKCSCNELLHPLNDFRKRAHHLSKPFIWKNRPDDQLIDPFQAGMLYHVCLYETASTSGHWIEFPFICKVQLESDRSHFIIFAQIPPFYWAFPLPLDGQDVPNITISDDMITSKLIVKTHYEKAMSDAIQLSGKFEEIIAGVNHELEVRRRSLDRRLQKWHDQLQKKKEEILKKGTELEAEVQACKEEQKQLHKEIAEIEAKREENKICMMDIQKNIERLEKEEKTACIAKEKKRCNHQLESFAGKQQHVLESNKELSTREVQCNEKLEKNASKQKDLYASKSELLKCGLCADLEPKLIIGYFRAISPCYLEVQL
jgi:uncharacterized coiled-coil DUF342 family protein